MVHKLIQDAIDMGQPLKTIREHLQEMGVRWSYSQRTQGKRERLRRLEQHDLCVTGCGRYADWSKNNICFDCRAEEWK